MKLLIADDDRQIREGIKEGIDWASLGIEEVLTASSGTEAFELFSAALPELVVTDVRMPGMDGLELLRRIKETRPATKVIILSGYNDFKYLKKAIQWDAADYEMKPIRARSLIRLIKKVSEEIVRERVSEETFRKYLASHKELFVEDLACGRIRDRLILLDGLAQYYRFDAKGTLLLVRVEPDRRGAETAQARSSVDAMLLRAREGRESEAGELWLGTKGGSLIGLLKLETTSYLYARHAAASLKNRLTEIVRATSAVGENAWSAGISAPGNAAAFNDLLSQAKEALDRRLYAGKGAVHAFDDADRLRDDTIRGLDDDVDFKALIREAEGERLSKRIDAEFVRLREERAYSEKSVAAYCKTLIRLLALFREPSAELAEFVQVRSEELDSRSFFEIGEYADFVRSAYDEAFKAYGSAGASRLSALMQLADAYIRKHYLQELTVERVAEHVGKTPNYFSHLFKKEMGVPFREYVNRLRIAKAKELIEGTTDRIYEIGERVGFADYAYFTQVFRKLEGRPPTAFRKNRP
ncbi:response regulator [Cohnella sp. GCM10020058]|uniref:response regulator transcription factor n=1 Tax=Cohnella sp. GCM10020058 TaxID=3317330 RepID=UPI003643026B